MLIALVGVLAFAAVWFTVLRPKDASTTTDETIVTPVAQNASTTAASAAAPAAASDGGTAITDRPAQAQSAVDAANSQIAGDQAQADAAAEGAAPAAPDAAASSSSSSSSSAASGAAPAAAAPTKKIVVAAGAPAGERAVLSKLEDGKVVVMLVWNGSSADDRAARSAVREATKGRDDVYVRFLRPDKVGAYEAITGGVTIAQTPTTIIIGPEQKAVTISGLIDPLEIKQAIGRMKPSQG